MKFTKEEKLTFVERYQNGETVLQICNENQTPRSTFYRWIQDYQQTVTDIGNIITLHEFLYLKKKIKKLEGTIQVLKKVSCIVSSPLREKLKAMDVLHGQFITHTQGQLLTQIINSFTFCIKILGRDMYCFQKEDISNGWQGHTR